MTSNKIALVTGANRGIGLEISKQLAENGVEVVMSSRDIDAGQEAFRKLNQSFSNLRYLPLDVTNEVSIKDAAGFIRSTFGRLDILVNNAGIMSDNKGALEVSIEVVKKTLDTNFYGPLRVSQAFIPLLNQSADGRIINLSSGMGALSEMGTGHAAYRFSKTALNSVTTALAAELSDSSVKVFSMCPGWVRTDMGGNNASRSVEEGAQTATWLALSDQPQSGKFYRDMAVIDW